MLFPPGWHKVVAVGFPPTLILHTVPLKLGWPKTISAVVSPLPDTEVAVSGVLNSSTRLLFASPTYKFPALSTATPTGSHIVLAVAAPGALHAPEVKLGWPKTRSAVVSPLPL